MRVTTPGERHGRAVGRLFVWSFADSCEWARGYGQRFGLVWVDYQTQARLEKDSARWYRQVIADHGFDHDWAKERLEGER